MGLFVWRVRGGGGGVGVEVGEGSWPRTPSCPVSHCDWVVMSRRGNRFTLGALPGIEAGWRWPSSPCVWATCCDWVPCLAASYGFYVAPDTRRGSCHSFWLCVRGHCHCGDLVIVGTLAATENVLAKATSSGKTTGDVLASQKDPAQMNEACSRRIAGPYCAANT